jgi:hypothetical protein
MSEEQATATPAKAKTEYTAVKMEDGRTVQFPGTRQVSKEINVGDGEVSVRFDFRNGATRSISSGDLTEALQLQALGHGLSQKIGDSWASIKAVEDMVLQCDELLEQVKGGNWFAPSAGGSGDSMAGASIVIRAIVEATGKDVAFVKDFLKKKLDAAKAAVDAGNPAAKLTRQDLYSSFRNPTTKTGQIIKRLEEEALTKNNKVDSSALLAEMGG